MRMLSIWFIRITPEGKPIKNLYVHVFVAVVLVLSSIGDTMGLNYLWGPFVLGLIIPAGSPLATMLTLKLDTVVYGLFIPIMSTFLASKLNLWIAIPALRYAVHFQLAIICYLIKLVATFVFVIPIKLSLKEAIALTLILNVKGITEMGYFLSYTPVEAGNLESVCGVLLVFLLTSYAPPLINLLYDPSKHYIGYKKKCIEYTPYDADLEILVCAHKQEDAMAAIKLFEISKPTKQSPISVYGLCLEELVSSATPLLINHQLGQKILTSQRSTLSRSQSIIDIFRYFKSEFEKSAQVNVFTAVSPLKQMHEDICWLAFDKTCSLIILPFHKKWNNTGKIVSNSIDFRNLNISVFDRAPCSVGILLDRRKNRGLSSIFDSSTIYHVALLFVGGRDDREALAYALRMSRSSELRLTIMHFVTTEEIVHDSWENMLDLESLKCLRQEIAMNMNITYIEEIVRDGSDTAAIVKSIQGSFDLIMAGRRHKSKPEAVSGLLQWAEYPELGEMGDLLASSDILSTVSILVMQQQILKADHSSILN
ncbi:cation/H(+) antiporter 4-like [Mercurialis annua]|uniref:cation/H(+) antiporter 4-like n=1 Tax=Mercurialis annua TaxID=3986 RepID=UPI0024AF7A59|nr:cation/H(+) antiporter 4-like [Mercurialis annua]